MSQFWHAHWAEDSFKPTSLGNWQVPNWHPKFPCTRHCATTTFLADRSGRLLPDQPRSKESPWGDFKGTWELPLKIDRKLARELSAPPKYKQVAWEAHKIHYQGSSGRSVVSPRKMKRKAPAKQVKVKKTTVRDIARAEKPIVKSDRVANKNLQTKFLKKSEHLTRKEPIKNVDREEHMEDEKSVAQEQWVEKLDREKHKEKKKSKCFCVYKSDSRLPVEVTTPKATRKNICTIHQRLRV